VPRSIFHSSCTKISFDTARLMCPASPCIFFISISISSLVIYLILKSTLRQVKKHWPFFVNLFSFFSFNFLYFFQAQKRDSGNPPHTHTQERNYGKLKTIVILALEHSFHEIGDIRLFRSKNTCIGNCGDSYFVYARNAYGVAQLLFSDDGKLIRYTRLQVSLLVSLKMLNVHSSSTSTTYLNSTLKNEFRWSYL
jgi:hypothetical protein